MNSILQALYHTEDLRDVIISSDFDKNSIVEALVQIFRQLNATSIVNSGVDTTTLIRTCAINPHIQEDAQEFLLSLLDKLDSASLHPLSSIFSGQIEQMTQCLNVNFTKTKLQRFIDLSLDILDCSNITDALINYFSDEVLTGENRIKAGDFGKQEAVRMSRLVQPPENLILQLKRFSYDMELQTMVKLHDRVEFPLVLDFNELKLCESDQPLLYDLYGVVLHDGDPSYGHYTVLTRSLLRDPDQWFYLNDAIVSDCDFEYVKGKGYGGAVYRMLGGSSGSCNAYLLFYKRRK